MRRLLLSILTVIISGGVMLTDLQAQTRGNSRQNTYSTRHGSNGNSRPGNNGNHNGSNRPSQSGKPSTPGHTINRPGNSQNRPSKPAVIPQRPSVNHRPGSGYKPSHSYRPGPSHNRPVHTVTARPAYLAPPRRAYRIPARHWSRPVPPPAWRATRSTPLLRGFMGLSFGISYTSAINSLYSSGYSVDGYGNDMVYLRGVTEQGQYFDDATLYFSGNRLTRSEFYRSTSYFNTSQYYSLRANLTAQYGAPAYQNSNGQTLTAQWFGYDGDYITLQYTPLVTDGVYRYFTILTYGD